MPKESGQNRQLNSVGVALQPEPRFIDNPPAKTFVQALANSQSAIYKAKSK